MGCQAGRRAQAGWVRTAIGEVSAMVEQRGATEDAELALFRAILASLPQGLAVIRAADTTVVWANERAAAILGVELDALIGRPSTSLLESGGDTATGTATLAYSPGPKFEHPEHGTVQLAVVTTAGGGATFAAVDSRKAVQQGVILPGRGTFQDDLVRELSRARRSGQPVSVAMLSIDGDLDFAVPDTLDLLSTATEAWRGALRDSDSIAYYDFGDFDYVALLPDCPADEASLVAERARSAARLTRTCSAGFASWNRDEDGLELTVRAHRALKRAQREGGDRSVAAAGG